MLGRRGRGSLEIWLLLPSVVADADQRVDAGYQGERVADAMRVRLDILLERRIALDHGAVADACAQSMRCVDRAALVEREILGRTTDERDALD
jgi:hypothetical protein